MDPPVDLGFCTRRPTSGHQHFEGLRVREVHEPQGRGELHLDRQRVRGAPAAESFGKKNPLLGFRFQRLCSQVGLFLDYDYLSPGGGGGPSVGRPKKMLLGP